MSDIEDMAIEMIEVLKASSNPAEAYIEMIQDPQSRQAAFMAFDNLGDKRLMEKIQQKVLHQLEKENPPFQKELMDLLMRRRDRIDAIEYSQSQDVKFSEQTQKQVSGKLKSAYWDIVIYVPPIVLQLYEIISDLLSLDLKLRMERCHIHHHFLLNTLFSHHSEWYTHWILANSRHLYWPLDFGPRFFMENFDYYRQYLLIIFFSYWLLKTVNRIRKLRMLKQRCKKMQNNVKLLFQIIGGPLRAINKAKQKKKSI